MKRRNRLDYQRAWHAKNKGARRKHDLKMKYGLSLNDYEALSKQQRNACAICETHREDLSKPLFVDHNHSTKKVRGLLCMSCNIALGNFQDNPEILDMAIRYLEREPKDVHEDKTTTKG